MLQTLSYGFSNNLVVIWRPISILLFEEQLLFSLTSTLWPVINSRSEINKKSLNFMNVIKFWPQVNKLILFSHFIELFWLYIWLTLIGSVIIWRAMKVVLKWSHQHKHRWIYFQLSYDKGLRLPLIPVWLKGIYDWFGLLVAIFALQYQRQVKSHLQYLEWSNQS